MKIEGNENNMSNIKNILQDKESVLVFDIDGVLAVVEFGENTHFDLNDEEWIRECENGVNYYTEKLVIKKMQDFLKDKNKSQIYVITKAYNENEYEMKKEFSNLYYGIPKENVYYVEDNDDKVKVLKKIKQNHIDLEDEKIVMIDDTISVLNSVMENSNFSTAHISSFLDI